MKEEPNYYAIIPADVRYDNKLPRGAVLLYGEITALSHQKGYCWASDNYFGRLYQVSRQTIQSWLKSLETEGYINRKIQYKEDSKEIQSRYIQILTTPSKENFTPPMQENLTDNITSINNKSGKSKSSKSKTYADDSFEMKMANLLAKLMDENNPTRRHSENLNSWADDVRLMLERDNRTEGQIEWIIRWSQRNTFWSTNILSMKKLRQQFDKMVVQIRKEKGQSPQTDVFTSDTDKKRFLQEQFRDYPGDIDTIMTNLAIEHIDMTRAEVEKYAKSNV